MGEKLLIVNKEVMEESRRRADQVAKKVTKKIYANNYVTSVKNVAEERVICRSGSDIILVGLTEGKNRPTAKVISFSEPGPRKAFVYEEKEGTVVKLPDKLNHAGYFVDACKIYDDNGVVTIIKGDKINVMKKNDTLFFRIGETLNQKRKALKAEEDRKIGVWRADD